MANSSGGPAGSQTAPDDKAATDPGSLKLVASQETETSILFRFMNVADPAAIIPRINSRYNFLENPFPSSSKFISAAIDQDIQDSTDFDDRMKNAIQTFNPLKPDELMSMNIPLYVFSQYIASSFTSETTIEEINDHANGVNPLANADVMTLWDNLYYQALTGNSTMMANAIVQVLRGNAFLRYYINPSGMYFTNTNPLLPTSNTGLNPGATNIGSNNPGL